MKSRVSFALRAVVQLILDVRPGLAGGEWAPMIREAQATLAEMPNLATMDEITKLRGAAQNASDNYNDEGCVEHVESALNTIAVASWVVPKSGDRAPPDGIKIQASRGFSVQDVARSPLL